MKNRISKMLMIILAIIIIAGCSQKSEKMPSSEKTSSGESSQAAGQNKSIPAIPDALIKEGWPVDLAPAELPEYTQGEVVNSGEDEDTLYIKIRETDEDKFEEYLDGLKDAGWIITVDSHETQAEKGLHTVRFQWQGGGEILQMAVYTMEAGSWPEDDIPPDVLQPEFGTLVGGVEILNAVEGVWYFNYTYDGIDEASAREYMELLMGNGWSGDMSQLSKSFEWKGRKYGATVEIYETVETRTTFTCNFYYAD